MLKIAICDDEVLFGKQIKNYIQNYENRTCLLCEIDVFSSGKEFLELGMEMMQYTIVFLDINMDEVDGIMTAQQIRKMSRDVFVVFVTAFMDYTLEGYKVDAVRYVLKNNQNLESAIHECMDSIIEKINYQVVTVDFKFTESEKRIALDRLVYIESKLHKLEFNVMEDCLKKYTLYETLNTIEETLKGNGFLRVHQSFLVNMKYMKSIERYKAILNNGMELMIPKARYKDVRDAFISHKGDM